MGYLFNNLLIIVFVKLILVQASFASSTSFVSVLPQLFHGMFFENSQRRDPYTLEEVRNIVRVTYFKPNGGMSYCTGFFIKNNGSRVLIGTARHCMEYDEQTACLEGRLNFQTTDSKPFSGQCKRVQISSLEDDFLVLEADFDKHQSELLNQRRGYHFRENEVPEYTRVKTLGYPSDPERKSSLTITENCWTLPESSPKFWDALNEAQRKELNEITAKNKKQYSEKVLEFKNKIDFVRKKYNCTTYGGNSGGPVVIEGTRVVIGLPAGYYPGYLYKNVETASSPYEDLVSFGQKFRDELQNLRIIINP